MSWAPKFTLLLKIAFRLRDTAAAEGLFLEGSVEFESGNVETARLMFYYGTRLDPAMAGNFYNLAFALERIEGPTARTIAAWERYLEVARDDRRQSPADREKAAAHLAALKSRAG